MEDRPNSAGSNPAADTIPAAEAVEASTFDTDEHPTEPAGFWMVAIYLVDKQYGGPEEGGWWYTAGVRMNHAIEEVERYGVPTIFQAEDSADTWAEIANKKLNDTINQRRPAISSVLSTGRYEARVFEGFAPEVFPAVRPHYE